MEAGIRALQAIESPSLPDSELLEGGSVSSLPLHPPSLAGQVGEFIQNQGRPEPAGKAVSVIPARRGWEDRGREQIQT